MATIASAYAEKHALHHTNYNTQTMKQHAPAARVGARTAAAAPTATATRCVVARASAADRHAQQEQPQQQLVVEQQQQEESIRCVSCDEWVGQWLWRKAGCRRRA